MNEERILDKLDSIEAHNREMLVALTRVEEQVKDMPLLRDRLNALERWRWVTAGALAAASTSLISQILKGLM